MKNPFDNHVEGLLEPKHKRERIYDITIVRSEIVASTSPRLNYIAKQLNK